LPHAKAAKDAKSGGVAGVAAPLNAAEV